MSLATVTKEAPQPLGHSNVGAATPVVAPAMTPASPQPVGPGRYDLHVTTTDHRGRHVLTQNRVVLS